jgi:hypothetical protein
MVTWKLVAPGAARVPLGKKVRTWLSAVLTLPSWLVVPTTWRSPEPEPGALLVLARLDGGLQ